MTISYRSPNVSPGSYTVAATATDNRGASVSTSSIAFTVSPNNPPSVTLVAPVDNAQGYVGAPINLSANASDSDGTITKVEFFVGATLLATKLTPPYAATWTPGSVGTFPIKAVGTDNNGGVATSSIANVVINANATPTVSLPAPASGNRYFTDATIVLAATATDSDGSVVRVDYYSGGVLIGTATAAPWRLVWDNAPVGVHAVTAVAVDNRGARTTSPAITITVLAGPAISVDASPFYPTGVDGASVDTDKVLIIGHVDAPANSGVLVNGRRVPFSPSTGRFFANNVALDTVGTNAIELQVVTEDEQVATRSIVVTRTGSKPFTLEFEKDEVLGLQTVTAWLRNPTGVALGNVVFNFTPSGTPTYFTQPDMGTVANVGVTLDYAQPGAYDLSVQVWNPGNTQVIFTARAMVRIYAPLEIDGIARRVYNRMIDRLTASNVTNAVKAINITARDDFTQLFTSYGAALPQIAASSNVIKQGTVSPDLAEYILLRTVGATIYGHSLYLMRGPDGVWRIDSM